MADSRAPRGERGVGAWLPTTSGGAEAVLLILLLGLRASVLLQAVFAAPMIGWVGVAVVAAMVLWTSISAVIVVRARRLLPWVTAVDVVFAMACILANAAGQDVSERLSGWAGWAYPVGLSTAALVGGTFGSWRVVVAVTTALTAVYVCTGREAVGDDLLTVIANSVAFYCYALIVWGVAGFLRRLAADADEARAAAAAAAQDAEREQHRRLLHDQRTVLAFLAHPVADPVAEAALRRQAARAAHRIDRFMASARRSGASSGGGDGQSRAASSLAAVVEEVADDFDDLPLTTTTYAAGCRLDEVTAAALRDALETLLHNVRRHAGADSVLVHAEAFHAPPPSGLTQSCPEDREGATAVIWSVIVRDDGCGFDPGTMRPGYGLGVLLAKELPQAGVSAEVTSTPGDGTRALLRGVGLAAGEPHDRPLPEPGAE